MKRITIIALLFFALTGCNQNKNMNTLTLTQEWDKTFPKSELVNHSKVTFHNRYGIELAADLYVPKNSNVKLPAIAVSGPFGAVKEQSSGLYAQHMAERGFLTIAFDPSFTGESGGEPRRMASPDINTEDFLAAVDFLSTCDLVDPERIGIIGICGFGGMAINAAASIRASRQPWPPPCTICHASQEKDILAAPTVKRQGMRSARPGPPSVQRIIVRAVTSAPAA